MGYKFNFAEADNLFSSIFDKYDVYAPKRFPKQGRYSDTDIIRYDKVKTINEIEFNQKSDYSAKEVLAPINETLFYFTENDLKKVLLLKNLFYYSQDLVILMLLKFNQKFMRRMVNFKIFIFQEYKII